MLKQRVRFERNQHLISTCVLSPHHRAIAESSCFLRLHDQGERARTSVRLSPCRKGRHEHARASTQRKGNQPLDCELFLGPMELTFSRHLIPHLRQKSTKEHRRLMVCDAVRSPHSRITLMPFALTQALPFALTQALITRRGRAIRFPQQAHAAAT